MKKTTKISFVFALALWIIGSVLLYRNGGPNSAIFVTGIIILFGFVYQIGKKENKID